MCRWKSPSPPTRGGSPRWLKLLAAFFLFLHPSLRFTVSSKKAHRRLIWRKRRHSLKRTIIFLDHHPFSPRGAPIPLPPSPPPRSERAGVKREKIKRCSARRASPGLGSGSRCQRRGGCRRGRRVLGRARWVCVCVAAALAARERPGGALGVRVLHPAALRSGAHTRPRPPSLALRLPRSAHPRAERPPPPLSFSVSPPPAAPRQE